MKFTSFVRGSRPSPKNSSAELAIATKMKTWTSQHLTIPLPNLGSVAGITGPLPSRAKYILFQLLVDRSSRLNQRRAEAPHKHAFVAAQLLTVEQSFGSDKDIPRNSLEVIDLSTRGDTTLERRDFCG